MDRYSGVFRESRQRNLAGPVVAAMDMVGPAIPRDLSVAGDPGGGSRRVMAGDQWPIIYRFGTGRIGAGSVRLGIQLGQRRSFRPWRCHGHLVSGALSGLWQQPVGDDVGASHCLGTIPLFTMGPKKDQGPVYSFYPLFNGRISDAKRHLVDLGVTPRSCPNKAGFPRGKTVGTRYPQEKYLRGSFTIEAALLVPLIFGILFLLLQTVVTLHDRVSGEAYRYEEICCNEKQDSWRFVQIAGAILEEWEEGKS